ncbi:MAG: PHP domain-containing protein [Actinobacteria bacterium]|nr:PHP domain-containing protein [Actinomycetota bacterium]
MRIKLDLHVHTVYSFDGTIDPDGLRAACRERGLAGAAVTDHDSLRGGLEFAAALPDLLIIPGSEIRSAEGEIIGLFLREDVPSGLSAEETMHRIHRQGGVVVIPHPFDLVKLKRMTARRLLEMRGEIDALEGMNGKPRWWLANSAARRFAAEHCFPVTGGSDAHIAAHVGAVYTEMEEFTTPEGFLASLREAEPGGGRYSPWSSQLERWRARTRRRLP